MVPKVGLEPACRAHGLCNGRQAHMSCGLQKLFSFARLNSGWVRLNNYDLERCVGFSRSIVAIVVLRESSFNVIS